MESWTEGHGSDSMLLTESQTWVRQLRIYKSEFYDHKSPFQKDYSQLARQISLLKHFLFEKQSTHQVHSKLPFKADHSFL